MSEDHKKQLNQQLWNIANTLRGKMDADEFRDYILEFIFYKYLSEKMKIYADEILKEDKMVYLDIKENTDTGKQYLEATIEQTEEEKPLFDLRLLSFEERQQWYSLYDKACGPNSPIKGVNDEVYDWNE